MRAVFVFPRGRQADTAVTLDRFLPQQRNPWAMDGNLYINIVDEHEGLLFADWEPEHVVAVESAVGHRPTWAVQADVSGRIDGTAEVYRLVTHLLDEGGIATDDYSDHCWTRHEIENGAVIDGLRFFDFSTRHELTRRQ